MPEVIRRINETLGEILSLQLSLWSWERQAPPSLGEPQDLINPHLDKADIVVAILWNRFGTQGSKGMTGTQEEVLRAIGQWQVEGRPRVMIYRCTRPSTLDLEGHLQAAELEVFLKKLPPALTHSYEGVRDFEKHVEQHLRMVLRALSDTTPKEPSTNRKKQIANLRELIAKQFAGFTLFTGTRSERSSDDEPTIESHYVPLEVTEKSPNVSLSASRLPAWDALIANQDNLHFAITGTPGSGKTTLLRYLAARLASGARQIVPVFLSLRIIEPRQQAGIDVAGLRELLRLGLHWHTNDPALDAYLVSDERLRAGDLVLLFDGLDEMEHEAADTFLDTIYRFNREFPKTRTIVTGRPLGWQGRRLPAFYRAFELLELGDEAVETYLDKRLGADTSASLLVRRTLAESERLNELGRNPLLLSMICTSLEKAQGIDPIENRSDLYRECTDVLLGRLYAQRPTAPSELDRQTTLAVLKDVACRFFLWQEPDFPLPQVQLMASAVVPRSAVEEIADMLDLVEQRCGLVQRSGDAYCFVHRSLWEYFTALAFIDKKPGALVHHAANPQWEEVVRLNVGLRARGGSREPFEQLIRQLWIVNRPLCVRTASEVDSAKRIVQSLISERDENTERLLLIDSLDQSLELLPISQWERVVYETLRTLFDSCGERDCEVLYRAERLLTRRGFDPLEPGGLIYELLDLAGAPGRQAAACTDSASGLEWINVKGGMGYIGHNKKGHDNEKPKRHFRFADFEMAKHPVTVQLGRDFKWGPGVRGSSGHASELKKPMTQVTWYEVHYLAMWLDCRLPTEEQWEYAARGGQLSRGHGRWFHGDEVDALSEWAWFDEHERSKPHDVSETDNQGRERNLNPLGLANMLGNIWEWTRTSYRDGAYIEQGGSETRQPIQVVKGERTMRGGTFKGSPDSVRCGRRVPTNPSNRGSTVGFRLVRGRQHLGDEPEQEEILP